MRLFYDLIDTAIDLLRLAEWRRRRRDEGHDPHPWPGPDADYDARVARRRAEVRGRR